MRINFRIKIGNYTFFSMFAHTQTLEGITSLMPNGKHVLLFDIEDCALEQTVRDLKTVQHIYTLSDIYITSDQKGSYRAWCFTQSDLMTYLKILTQIKNLDYGFFYYTVKRRKATLRISQKQNRPPQKIVSVLYSYPVPIPERFEKVIYDTGIEKKGKLIRFGNKEALDDNVNCGDNDMLGRRES